MASSSTSSIVVGRGRCPSRIGAADGAPAGGPLAQLQRLRRWSGCRQSRCASRARARGAQEQLVVAGGADQR